MAHARVMVDEKGRYEKGRKEGIPGAFGGQESVLELLRMSSGKLRDEGGKSSLESSVDQAGVHIQRRFF